MEMQTPGPALQGLVSKVLGVMREARSTPDWLRSGDPRDALWLYAGEAEKQGLRRRQLMSFLCWLYFKQGVHDLGALRGVALAMGEARHPYRYFRVGSKALARLEAMVAVQRHEGEKAAREAEDQKLGIGRKP